MVLSNTFQLKRARPSQEKLKILTVVMDGVGFINPEANISQELSKNSKGILPSEAFFGGNAVNAAYTPHLAQLCSGSLFRTLKAHGTAVGLPSDEDMGNSEVGHNALGAGRVFAQGAKLVNSALQSGDLFSGEAWQHVVSRRTGLKNKLNTLHFCGLLSDGNVHSHINHLFELIRGAKKEGVHKVRLHVLLDGRDVGPLTALNYVDTLNQFLSEINSANFDCRVASGGGRTFVTMDRYESDWSIVERGYNAHILGEGRHFDSLSDAISSLRAEKNYFDQDLPPFVITENGIPIGTVNDDDSFVFFNFRGDRAIQISRALTEQNFSSFQRKRFPKIYYAGMMQYDGDLKLPEHFLVSPPAIDKTLTELLSAASVKQFACSETQKYGHVTYFWNGNKTGKFVSNFENYIEIPSDLSGFDQRPWMKSAEIADETIKQMHANSFEIGRINFANGDMVGHTGNFNAAVLAVAAVDLALGRIMQAAKETNTVLLVLADHGNADEMFELDKKTKKVVFDKKGQPKLKTSHTLAPVPFAIFNAEALDQTITLKENLEHAGLANVAATVLDLAGFEPPNFYEPSLIQFSDPKKKINHKNVQAQNNAAPQIVNVSNLSSQDNYYYAKTAIDFAETIAKLRAPDGCPWDREQTFGSLRSYLIEEAYEAVDAITKYEQHPSRELSQNFCDELGDVLLQVYLHAQIASEASVFSISHVFKAINKKMIDRHPHVFNKTHQDIKTADDVATQWEQIKEQAQPQNEHKGNSLLKKALKKRSLPTLNFASQISKRAKAVGFSWPQCSQVFSDVLSEIKELQTELEVERIDPMRVADEIGDVIFAMSNLVQFLKETTEGCSQFDFDFIVRAAIEKFINRFFEMEKIMQEKNMQLTDETAKQLSLDNWNELWSNAKKRRYC